MLPSVQSSTLFIQPKLHSFMLTSAFVHLFRGCLGLATTYWVARTGHNCPVSLHLLLPKAFNECFVHKILDIHAKLDQLPVYHSALAMSGTLWWCFTSHTQSLEHSFYTTQTIACRLSKTEQVLVHIHVLHTDQFFIYIFW